jgi:heat shock protein beta
MQKLMMANAREDDAMMKMMMQMPKILEINPNSPLIEGLLERVYDLPPVEDEDVTSHEQEELQETVRVLLDTAMIRSGFMVADTNTYVAVKHRDHSLTPRRYFERVEALLRRSLGVSPSAQTRTNTVKPAPPVAREDLPDPDEAMEMENLGAPGGVGFEFGENGPEFMDWSELKARAEEKDERELDDVVEEALSHDEL